MLCRVRSTPSVRTSHTTRVTRKRSRESLDCWTVCLGACFDEAMAESDAVLQTTLCMIKPDAVRNNRVADIEKVLLDHGFVILAKKRFQVRVELSVDRLWGLWAARAS